MTTTQAPRSELADVRPSPVSIPSWLTPDDLREMYRLMVLSRTLDQRIWVLSRAGEVPLAAPCSGQEGAQVGAAYALCRFNTTWLPYYRDLGVVVTAGMTPQEVLLCGLTRAGDPNSGGRQMGAHWGHPKLHIITMSSPVANQLSHAVGIALASKIRHEEVIAFVSFGDGAASRGEFHESLNFAAIHKLPVLFFCENNGYAISVPFAAQCATSNVAERAAAYGIPGVCVEGDDVFAVYRATWEAAQRAIRGEGPTLIEALTYRYLPHTNSDDDRRYRQATEVEAWKSGKDPIQHLRQVLADRGILSDADDAALRQQVQQEVDDATAFAQAAPYPSADDLATHVFAP